MVRLGVVVVGDEAAVGHLGVPEADLHQSEEQQATLTGPPAVEPEAELVEVEDQVVSPDRALVRAH